MRALSLITLLILSVCSANALGTRSPILWQIGGTEHLKSEFNLFTHSCWVQLANGEKLTGRFTQSTDGGPELASFMVSTPDGILSGTAIVNRRAKGAFGHAVLKSPNSSIQILIEVETHQAGAKSGSGLAYSSDGKVYRVVW